MHCDILNKGTGIPIVFLHGFLGTTNDWKQIVSYLPERTCLAYDLPGHGKSPWIEMDICDLIDSSLPPQSIDLVGYSMGGRLAMHFALQRPNRIHSLTIISAHYGLAEPEQKQLRLQEDRIWAQKILTLPFDQFLKSWYDRPIFASLKQKPDLYREMISLRKKSQRNKDLVRAMHTWSLGKQDYLGNALRSFSHPWRILYGEQDNHYSNLYAGWPNSYCISNAGHTVLLESPKEVAALL